MRSTDLHHHEIVILRFSRWQPSAILDFKTEIFNIHALSRHGVHNPAKWCGDWSDCFRDMKIFCSCFLCLQCFDAVGWVV